MHQETWQTDLSLTAEIKLYYDLHIPDGAPEKAPLLVAVHGYGAHKRYMMREAQAIAPESFVIVSLQAPHQHFRQTESGYRVGFGWLTDHRPDESVKLHHDFILRVIEQLAERELIDRRQIFLYGFSQACALNFRFALTFPELMRGVIGVGGGIPSDLETSDIYRPFAAPTFYLYGDADEFYPLEKFQAFEQKLKNYLPNFESKMHHAKHEISDEMRRDMKEWLDQQRIMNNR